MAAENGLDTPLNKQNNRPPAAGPDGVDRLRSSLSPWIGSAGYDLACFVLGPLWVWGAVSALQPHVDVAALYLVTMAFLAVGHQLPSFLRVWGHRDLSRPHGTGLVVGLLSLSAVAVACVWADLAALTVVLLLWGVWHAMTHTYGIMRIYDSKVQSFAGSTIWLDYLTTATWFGAGVLFSPHRMEQLLTALYGCGMPLLEPVAVPATQLVWGGLTVVLTTAFVMNYIAQRRQGQRPGLMKLAAMVSNIGFWWYAMVSVQDLLLGILLYEAFHAIQNLALVRVAMRHAVASGGGMARWAGFLGAGGLVGGVWLVAAAALYGLPSYLAQVTPFGMAEGLESDLLHRAFFAWVAASTMVHFYWDGWTWRLRDAAVRSSLGVPAAPAGAADRARRGVAWSRWAASSAVLVLLFGLLGASQLWRGPTKAGVLANLAEAIPQSWSARANYGTWLLSQARARDAQREFEDALALRPQSAELMCKLGLALLAQQDFDGAMERFLGAVDCDPGSALAKLCLGKALIQEGRINEGLEQLYAAVALAPQDASYYYELGLAQATTDDPRSPSDDDESFGKALTSLDRAIELDRSSAEAHNARGMVHLQLGDYDAAAADFDEAIRLAPHLYKAYRNLALLWDQRHEPEKAIEVLTTLIAINPTSSHHVMRGNVYFALKQYDKARDDFLAGMRLSGQDVEPVKRLVDLYLDESYRDPALAIEYAQMACAQTHWRDFRALALLAASCAAAANPAQAIRWQEEALRVVPPDLPEHIKLDLRQRLDQYRGNDTASPAAEAGEDAPAPPAPAVPDDNAGAAGSVPPAE